MTGRVKLNQETGMALLMGNEAIARGAIEAGVDFATAYPGSPSTEILECLAEASPRTGASPQTAMKVEWSVNEKVALEAAAGASFAGLRALTAMKQNGLNVALDFLMGLALTGTKGGLVIVTCDDPQAHSSTTEGDSRPLCRAAEIPVLEPASFQDAKDVTRWAFELSEKVKLPVVVRGVTRICHSRGNVKLGPIMPGRPQASLSTAERFVTLPVGRNRRALRGKLKECEKLFETSPFNTYSGPDQAQTIVVGCGVGWLYAREAIEGLGLDKSVGLMKLVTPWPLPQGLLLSLLTRFERVVVVEELTPFVEEALLALAGSYAAQGKPVAWVLGQHSGHLSQDGSEGLGELNPDSVGDALARIEELPLPARDLDYLSRAREAAELLAPVRELAMCAGCPHRASLWIIKAALALDGRDGYVLGDIGCYTLGVFRSGFQQLKTVHCMGSGVGLGSGLGRLADRGFEWPVVSVVGDSTFFHACLPAVMDAVYSRSDLTLVILDNSATAMTGFQPHPGTGVNACGAPAPLLSIERILEAMGVHVRVCDPFEIADSTDAFYNLLQMPGVKAAIFREPCALMEVNPRTGVKRRGPFRVYVDRDRCIGDACGCARFCVRVFACPGNVWDEAAGKAAIDETVCTGCGVCIDLCPRDAIHMDYTPASPREGAETHGS